MRARLVSRSLAGLAFGLFLGCKSDFFGLPPCEDSERGPMWARASLSLPQIQDPAASSLSVQLRVGDTVPVFVADTSFERPVVTACSLLGYSPSRVEWASTNSNVAMGRGDGTAYGVLRALAPGVARVWANVRFGNRRLVAELSYRCCTGSPATTAASCPAKPSPCQDVSVDRIVVVP